MADCCCLPRRTSFHNRFSTPTSGDLRNSPEQAIKRLTNTTKYANAVHTEPLSRVPVNGATASSSTQADDSDQIKPNWFCGNSSRAQTTEQLSSLPVGSFAVRLSTSRAGCLALDVRVPRFCNSSGFAHFLILRTRTGFALQGVPKEWPDLCALVTHLSIMPEMLPCPLLVSDPEDKRLRRTTRRLPRTSMTSHATVTSHGVSYSTPSSDSGVGG